MTETPPADSLTGPQSGVADGAITERLPEISPECRRRLDAAGAALIVGDFSAAKELTNTAWQADAEVPLEALPLVEVASDEPCMLTVKDIPPQLEYWLQHPDQRLRHSMTLATDAEGRTRAVWRGPSAVGLQQAMAGYVIKQYTDTTGQTDWQKVNDIIVPLYDGNFLEVPGVAAVELHGDHEIELTFDTDTEDESAQAGLRELADAVGKHQEIGEVGFTFSVRTGENGEPVALDGIRVFDQSAQGAIHLPDEHDPDSLGHTHPTPLPFSGRDISMIAKHPNIPHLVIIGNNRGYLYQPGTGMLMVEFAPLHTRTSEGF